MAAWFISFLAAALGLGIEVWMENPASSWMFRLPEFVALTEHFPQLQSWIVDYCRFKKPWRRRTRFALSCKLGGTMRLCQCHKPHQILRGRSKAHRQNWTRVAQAYPRGVCHLLASSLSHAVDSGERSRLSNAGCAKTGSLRVGSQESRATAVPG